MTPTAGRIVHYSTDADPMVQYPAIIQKVVKKPGHPNSTNEDDYDCYLSIFFDTGPGASVRVPYSTTYSRGRWTWIPQA